TPYEILHKKKPDMGNIPEWGARVWVHRKDRGKLEPRADVVHWVGFDEDSRGHRIYWPEKRRITVERNVDFEGEGMVSPGDTELRDDSKDDINKAQIPPLDPQQAPPAQPQSPAPDPLPNFEPQEAESQGDDIRRSSRVRKASRYIRDIVEGKGTSQQLPGKPAYPKGLQVPSN
ncbi:hypothetical protein M422DRAFT_145635, partial [Sphaerobolus stellatus SS14]